MTRNIINTVHVLLRRLQDIKECLLQSPQISLQQQGMSLYLFLLKPVGYLSEKHKSMWCMSWSQQIMMLDSDTVSGSADFCVKALIYWTTLYSDKSWFHLSGYVNSQSVHLWSTENPHVQAL